MPSPDWRSPAAYDYAAAIEPAGLAWEFLRRNLEYRAAHAAASKCADEGPGGPARRWGLRFFRRSEPAR